MRLFTRALAALAVVLAGMTVIAPAAGASSSILGGGSGFAALEIDQWRADTARSPFNLSVNYVAQGSTFGRTQFANGQFDFGASDIQYPPEELPELQTGRCKGKAIDNTCFVYVPVSAGGLSFMYNLTDGSGNRISNLRLTRKAVCGIFTGAITKWNDPEIAQYNPELSSYAHTIKQIVRSDGAGESYVLSEYCLAVEPQMWSNFIAQQKNGGDSGGVDTPEFYQGQPTSVWPPGGYGNAIAVSTADSTANYVADPVGGPDAITYVAAGYAKVRNFPVASVQNGANVFTQPDESNVTIALGYATGRANGTFQIAYNGPDPKAYFPSTYSYILAQTTGFDPGKGASLAQFLCYAVSKGQEVAPQLRYARLSSVLVNIAINAIVQIPGAPSRAACPVAGAPPPPPPPVVCRANCGGGSDQNGTGSNQTNGNSSNSSSVGNNRGNGNSNGSSSSNGSNNVTANLRPCTSAAAATTTTTVKAAAASGKATTTTTAKAKTAAPTTTTSTTIVCTSSSNDSGGNNGNGNGSGNGETSTTLSADAMLASQSSPASGSGSSTPSIWLLLAGAVAMLVLTTAWQMRKAT